MTDDEYLTRFPGVLRQLDPILEEQISFLNPVDVWVDNLLTTYGRGIAPRYFHEIIQPTGTKSELRIKTMPELIDQAVKLILSESRIKWEELRGQGVFTAFETGISRVISTAVSEERGIAAFVLQTYQPIPKGSGGAIPLRAGIYGIRRAEDMLRGQLFLYDVPSSHRDTSPKTEIFKISDGDIKGSILTVAHKNGKTTERKGFDLGSI